MAVPEGLPRRGCGRWDAARTRASRCSPGVHALGAPTGWRLECDEGRSEDNCPLGEQPFCSLAPQEGGGGGERGGQDHQLGGNKETLGK